MLRKGFILLHLYLALLDFKYSTEDDRQDDSTQGNSSLRFRISVKCAALLYYGYL